MEELNQRVRANVEDRYNLDIIAISPREIAEAVYSEIDPERRAPLLVQESSKNDLRRRAEAELRAVNKAEEARVESGQADAFTGHLQSTYPCEREGVNVYVAPAHMTDEEGERNISRLRSEAGAKLKHADALEAYFESRNSQAT